MSATSELWTTLCKDLQGRRTGVQPGEYTRIAKEFVAAASQLLRPGSERLADAHEIAGDICQEAGSIEDAMNDYYQALAAHAELGTNASAGRVAGKIAQLLSSSRRFSEAVPFFESAISFLDAAGDHSRHASLLNALAAAKKRTGDFDGACAAYRDAIAIVEQLHGPRHPELALLINNLGVEFTENGRFDEAETCLLQGLSMRENIFGATHPEVAHSLNNLGALYHTRGDFQLAANYYQAAIDIYRRFSTDETPELRALADNLLRVSRRA